MEREGRAGSPLVPSPQDDLTFDPGLFHDEPKLAGEPVAPGGGLFGEGREDEASALLLQNPGEPGVKEGVDRLIGNCFFKEFLSARRSYRLRGCRGRKGEILFSWRDLAMKTSWGQGCEP